LDKDESFKSFGKEYETEIKRIIYSIDRLGDSESLVSVKSVDVNIVEAEKPSSEEVKVNTLVEEDLVKSVSGDYIYTIMPDLRDRSKPKKYYVPLFAYSERSDVYRPSEFNVLPKENTLMVKAQDVILLFTHDHQ
jgi:CRISPR/Cas system-associated protein Cas5 (RAMP superfamily)